MRNDEEFVPEAIEEQIARHFSSVPSDQPLSPEAKVIQALQTYFKEDQLSAARMRERLIQYIQTMDATTIRENSMWLGNEQDLSPTSQNNQAKQATGDRKLQDSSFGDKEVSTLRSQGAREARKGSRRPLAIILSASVAAALVIVTVVGWAALSAAQKPSVAVPSVSHSGPAAPGISHSGGAPLVCSFVDKATNGGPFPIRHTLSWSALGELTSTSWNLDTQKVGTSCQPVAALSGSEASDAVWSPNGTHLLKVWTSAQILDSQGNVLITHTLNPATVSYTTQASVVPLRSMSGSGNALEGSVWSPNGKQVASIFVLGAGPTYGVEVWNAATGAHQMTLACQNDGDFGIEAVAWSANGKYIAASAPHGAGICIFDATTGALVASPPAYADQLTFSPDSKELAWLDNDDGHVHVYDLASKQSVRFKSPESNEGVVGHISWSPDGKSLAVGIHNLFVLNAKTGAIVDDIALTAGTDVVDLAWSPDSAMLASMSDLSDGTSSDGTVSVWRLV